MFVLKYNNKNRAGNWLIINISNYFLKNGRFEIVIKELGKVFHWCCAATAKQS